MKLHPRAGVLFEVSLTLSEAEARALLGLTRYRFDDFMVALYRHLGTTYLRPHEGFLQSLFRAIAEQLTPEIASVDEARAALSSTRLEDELARTRAALAEANRRIDTYERERDAAAKERPAS